MSGFLEDFRLIGRPRLAAMEAAEGYKFSEILLAFLWMLKGWAGLSLLFSFTRGLGLDILKFIEIDYMFNV